MKSKSKLNSRDTAGHQRGARVHVLRGAGQEAFYTLRDASTRTRHGRAAVFRFVQDYLWDLRARQMWEHQSRQERVHHEFGAPWSWHTLRSWCPNATCGVCAPDRVGTCDQRPMHAQNVRMMWRKRPCATSPTATRRFEPDDLGRSHGKGSKYRNDSALLPTSPNYFKNCMWFKSRQRFTDIGDQDTRDDTVGVRSLEALRGVAKLTATQEPRILGAGAHNISKPSIDESGDEEVSRALDGHTFGGNIFTVGAERFRWGEVLLKSSFIGKEFSGMHVAQVIIGLRKRRIPHRVHLSARNMRSCGTPFEATRLWAQDTWLHGSSSQRCLIITQLEKDTVKCDEHDARLLATGWQTPLHVILATPQQLVHGNVEEAVCCLISRHQFQRLKSVEINAVDGCPIGDGITFHTSSSFALTAACTARVQTQRPLHSSSHGIG